MQKHDLIKAVAVKTGLSIADSMMVMQALMNAINEGLSKDKRVEIEGFGVFEERTWAARYGHNPATGESLYIKERKRAVFIADERLIKAIQSKRSDCDGHAHDR